MVKFCVTVLLFLCIFVSFAHSQALDRTHIDYVNPLEYGSTCTAATLNNAITAIGVNNRTLMITATDRAKVACTWTLTGNVNVPANVVLWLPKGTAITVNSGVTFSVLGPLRIEGLITVAASHTVTLDTCPIAERHKIFEADGSITGVIRYAVGACGAVYPEWWGIDGTGATDNTTLWIQVIAAAKYAAPIALHGRYLVSSSGGAGISLDDGVQIVGTYVRGNQGTANSDGSRITCTGTGRCIQLDGTAGVSRNDVRLENVFVVESGTNAGSTGVYLESPQSMRLTNVMIKGFDTGLNVQGNVWYGEHRLVRIRDTRVQGALYAGPVNGGEIELGISTAASTSTCFDFGTTNRSHGVKLTASVECITTPLNVSINNVQGIDARLYTEESSGTRSIDIISASGRIFIYALGNAAHTVGTVRVSSTGGVAAGVFNAQHLTLEGFIQDGGQAADIVFSGAGGDSSGYHAIDISRLKFNRSRYTSLNYTVGHYLKDKYHTAGSLIPSVDQGPGDTDNSDEWKTGDIVWNTDAPAEFPTLWMNSVAGNPGTWQGHSLWNNTRVDMTSGDATPSVAGINYLRSVGTTTITGFDDCATGQVLVFHFFSALTLTHSATLLIGGDFTGAVGDVVTLLCTSGPSTWNAISVQDNTP